MFEDADFDFADQIIVATNILLSDQAQITQLLEVMIGHAGAAKTQCLLDVTDTLGFSSLEKVPVNFPSFTPKGIF
jgi:hypothetical protein